MPMHEYSGLALFGSVSGMTDDDVMRIVSAIRDSADGVYLTQRYAYHMTQSEDGGTAFLWRTRGRRPSSARCEKIAALLADGSVVRH